MRGTAFVILCCALQYATANYGPGFDILHPESIGHMNGVHQTILNETDTIVKTSDGYEEIKTVRKKIEFDAIPQALRHHGDKKHHERKIMTYVIEIEDGEEKIYGEEKTITELSNEEVKSASASSASFSSASSSTSSSSSTSPTEGGNRIQAGGKATGLLAAASAASSAYGPRGRSPYQLGSPSESSSQQRPQRPDEIIIVTEGNSGASSSTKTSASTSSSGPSNYGQRNYGHSVRFDENQGPTAGAAATAGVSGAGSGFSSVSEASSSGSGRVEYGPSAPGSRGSVYGQGFDSAGAAASSNSGLYGYDGLSDFDQVYRASGLFGPYGDDVSAEEYGSGFSSGSAAGAAAGGAGKGGKPYGPGGRSGSAASAAAAAAGTQSSEAAQSGNYRPGRRFDENQGPTAGAASTSGGSGAGGSGYYGQGSTATAAAASTTVQRESAPNERIITKHRHESPTSISSSSSVSSSGSGREEYGPSAQGSRGSVYGQGSDSAGAAASSNSGLYGYDGLSDFDQVYRASGLFGPYGDDVSAEEYGSGFSSGSAAGAVAAGVGKGGKPYGPGGRSGSAASAAAAAAGTQSSEAAQSGNYRPGRRFDENQGPTAGAASTAGGSGAGGSGYYGQGSTATAAAASTTVQRESAPNERIITKHRHESPTSISSSSSVSSSGSGREEYGPSAQGSRGSVYGQGSDSAGAAASSNSGLYGYDGLSDFDQGNRASGLFGPYGDDVSAEEYGSGFSSGSAAGAAAAGAGKGGKPYGPGGRSGSAASVAAAAAGTQSSEAAQSGNNRPGRRFDENQGPTTGAASTAGGSGAGGSGYYGQGSTATAAAASTTGKTGLPRYSEKNVIEPGSSTLISSSTSTSSSKPGLVGYGPSAPGSRGFAYGQESDSGGDTAADNFGLYGNDDLFDQGYVSSGVGPYGDFSSSQEYGSGSGSASVAATASAGQSGSAYGPSGSEPTTGFGASVTAEAASTSGGYDEITMIEIDRLPTVTSSSSASSSGSGREEYGPSAPGSRGSVYGQGFDSAGAAASSNSGLYGYDGLSDFDQVYRASGLFGPYGDDVSAEEYGSGFSSGSAAGAAAGGAGKGGKPYGPGGRSGSAASAAAAAAGTQSSEAAQSGNYRPGRRFDENQGPTAGAASTSGGSGAGGSGYYGQGSTATAAAASTTVQRESAPNERIITKHRHESPTSISSSSSVSSSGSGREEYGPSAQGSRGSVYGQGSDSAGAAASSNSGLYGYDGLSDFDQVYRASGLFGPYGDDVSAEEYGSGFSSGSAAGAVAAGVGKGGKPYGPGGRSGSAASAAAAAAGTQSSEAAQSGNYRPGRRFDENQGPTAGAASTAGGSGAGGSGYYGQGSTATAAAASTTVQRESAPNERIITKHRHESPTSISSSSSVSSSGSGREEYGPSAQGSRGSVYGQGSDSAGAAASSNSGLYGYDGLSDFDQGNRASGLFGPYGDDVSAEEYGSGFSSGSAAGAAAAGAGKGGKPYGPGGRSGSAASAAAAAAGTQSSEAAQSGNNRPGRRFDENQGPTTGAASTAGGSGAGGSGYYGQGSTATAAAASTTGKTGLPRYSEKNVIEPGSSTLISSSTSTSSSKPGLVGYGPSAPGSRGFAYGQESDNGGDTAADNFGLYGNDDLFDQGYVSSGVGPYGDFSSGQEYGSGSGSASVAATASAGQSGSAYGPSGSEPTSGFGASVTAEAASTSGGYDEITMIEIDRLPTVTSSSSASSSGSGREEYGPSAPGSRGSVYGQGFDRAGAAASSNSGLYGYDGLSDFDQVYRASGLFGPYGDDVSAEEYGSGFSSGSAAGAAAGGAGKGGKPYGPGGRPGSAASAAAAAAGTQSSEAAQSGNYRPGRRFDENQGPTAGAASTSGGSGAGGSGYYGQGSTAIAAAASTTVQRESAPNERIIIKHTHESPTSISSSWSASSSGSGREEYGPSAPGSRGSVYGQGSDSAGAATSSNSGLYGYDALSEFDQVYRASGLFGPYGDDVSAEEYGSGFSSGSAAGAAAGGAGKGGKRYGPGGRSGSAASAAAAAAGTQSSEAAQSGNNRPGRRFDENQGPTAGAASTAGGSGAGGSGYYGQGSTATAAAASTTVQRESAPNERIITKHRHESPTSISSSSSASSSGSGREEYGPSAPGSRGSVYGQGSDSAGAAASSNSGLYGYDGLSDFDQVYRASGLFGPYGDDVSSEEYGSGFSSGSAAGAAAGGAGKGGKRYGPGRRPGSAASAAAVAAGTQSSEAAQSGNYRPGRRFDENQGSTAGAASTAGGSGAGGSGYYGQGSTATAAAASTTGKTGLPRYSEKNVIEPGSSTLISSSTSTSSSKPGLVGYGPSAPGSRGFAYGQESDSGGDTAADNFGLYGNDDLFDQGYVSSGVGPYGDFSSGQEYGSGSGSASVAATASAGQSGSAYGPSGSEPTTGFGASVTAEAASTSGGYDEITMIEIDRLPTVTSSSSASSSGSGREEYGPSAPGSRGSVYGQGFDSAGAAASSNSGLYGYDGLSDFDQVYRASGLFGPYGDDVSAEEYGSGFSSGSAAGAAAEGAGKGGKPYGPGGRPGSAASAAAAAAGTQSSEAAQSGNYRPGRRFDENQGPTAGAASTSGGSGAGGSGYYGQGSTATVAAASTTGKTGLPRYSEKNVIEPGSSTLISSSTSTSSSKPGLVGYGPSAPGSRGFAYGQESDSGGDTAADNSGFYGNDDLFDQGYVSSGVGPYGDFSSGQEYGSGSGSASVAATASVGQSGSAYGPSGSEPTTGFGASVPAEAASTSGGYDEIIIIEEDFRLPTVTSSSSVSQESYAPYRPGAASGSSAFAGASSTAGGQSDGFAAGARGRKNCRITRGQLFVKYGTRRSPCTTC